jgi:hypothetical protein
MFVQITGAWTYDEVRMKTFNKGWEVSLSETACL